MKCLSANLDSLRELYIHQLYINQLQMLLSTEEQITEALPMMVEKATDPELKEAFETHLRKTEGHVGRVEQMLSRATAETKSINCRETADLVMEAEDMIHDATDERDRDAALVEAAQRVQQHEIESYGAAHHFAVRLGQSRDASLLDQTLREEGRASRQLTLIAGRVSPDRDAAVRDQTSKNEERANRLLAQIVGRANPFGQKAA